MTSMSLSNKALALRVPEEILAGHNTGLVEELFADDFVEHDPLPLPHSPVGSTTAPRAAGKTGGSPGVAADIDDPTDIVDFGLFPFTVDDESFVDARGLIDDPTTVVDFGLFPFRAQDIDTAAGTTRAALEADLEALFVVFPDLSCTTDDIIAEDDKVVMRLTFTGTHRGEYLGCPASGRRITWTEMHECRLRDGRIVEHWREEDDLALLRQMGAQSMPVR